MLYKHYLIASALLCLWGCTASPGAYLSKSDGPTFAESKLTKGATLIFYRPQSSWADDEIEAPGIFIDNELQSGLPGNSFVTFAAEPGFYRVEMRRPLFGNYWTLLADGPLDITLITSFQIEIKPNEGYYFRYDESDLPPKDAVVSTRNLGPLRLVTPLWAQKDMSPTHQLQPLVVLAPNDQKVRPQRKVWERVGQAIDKVGI